MNTPASVLFRAANHHGDSTIVDERRRKRLKVSQVSIRDTADGFDLEIKRADIGVSVFPAGRVPQEGHAPVAGCFAKTRVRTVANGRSEMRFVRSCRGREMVQLINDLGIEHSLH